MLALDLTIPELRPVSLIPDGGDYHLQEVLLVHWKRKKTRERKSMKETGERDSSDREQILLLPSKEKLGWGGRCAEIL